jgi:hypothetical protein
MAPNGPSSICKRLFRKEMLVGAVGIEPTSQARRDSEPNSLLFSRGF